jgi:hypothetical protein
MGQPPAGAALLFGAPLVGSIALTAAVESVVEADVVAVDDDTVVAVVAPATVVAVDASPAMLVGVEPVALVVVGPVATGVASVDVDDVGVEVAGPDVGVSELTVVGTVVTGVVAFGADVVTVVLGAADSVGATDDADDCVLDEPSELASAGAAAAHARATKEERVRTDLRAMTIKIGGFLVKLRQDAL